MNESFEAPTNHFEDMGNVRSILAEMDSEFNAESLILITKEQAESLRRAIAGN